MTALRLAAAAIAFAAGAIISTAAQAANVAYLSGGALCPLFTGGLYEIAATLRARGFETHVGCNFPLAEIFAHRRDRIVLIGHSFGALHAEEAALDLQIRGMNYTVIGIDPLFTGAVCWALRRCICIYGQGNKMPGATRTIFIRSGYGHIRFTSDPRVQAAVIAAAIGR